MSIMPFSVSVGIKIDVPKKPVCKQFSCSAKFWRRRATRFSLAVPSTKPFFSAKSAGVCMVLRISVLNVPSSLRNVVRRYSFARWVIASYFAASLPVAAAMSRIIEALIAQ